MCGIAGFFALSPSADPMARLMTQVATLSHRGPDGKGHYVASKGRVELHREGNSRGQAPSPFPWRGPLETANANLEVGLGMRRLAIVDLQGGHAPVASERGDVVVVMNGEIYNHEALAQALKARGHRFSSRCDTEVLAHLYEEFGFEGLLAQVQGMFAIALFDVRKGALFLARDALGIKPLYVAEQVASDGIRRLTFGSELKAIVADPDFHRAMDPVALSRYLVMEAVPAPYTILKDVVKVEPGTYLEISRAPDGSIARRRRVFWRIPERGADGLTNLPPMTDTKAWTTLVWAQLQEAVASRVPKEVPVASLLSGGIDSGLITALLAKALPERLMSFSLAFEDPEFNEANRASLTAQHVGADHHIVPFGEGDLPGLLGRIGPHMDEPLGDHSLIPTWRLMEAVGKAGYPVALAGDGGDELFAGYPTYLARRLDGLWDRFPQGLAATLLKGLDRAPTTMGNFAWDIKARLLLEGILAKDGPSRQARWMGAMAPGAALDLLSPGAREGLREANKGDPLSEVRKWAWVQRRRGGLEQALVQDLRFYLQDVILTKEDRASMGSSVEVRVPMLDTRLVGLAMCLPSHLRIQRWQTKWVLRQLAGIHLPQEIAQGPKKGFGMPTARWLRSLPEAQLKDWLAPPKGAPVILEDAAVQGYLRAHLEGRSDHRRVLWTLIMLRQWQKGPWGAELG